MANVRAPQAYMQVNARIRHDVGLRLYQRVDEERQAGRRMTVRDALTEAVELWLAAHQAEHLQESEIVHAQPE